MNICNEKKVNIGGHWNIIKNANLDKNGGIEAEEKSDPELFNDLKITRCYWHFAKLFLHSIVLSKEC